MRVEVRNLGQAQKAIGAAIRRVGAVPDEARLQLFSRIGIATLRWVDRNFRSGGALVGGWAPLRPLTVFARRKGSDVPLSDTGKLRQSFTFQATPNGVVVGTPLIVAKYHQLGTLGRGPEFVYPKFRRALAFPAPPEVIRQAGVGGFFRYRPAGTKGAPQTFTSVHLPKVAFRAVALTTAKSLRAAGFALPRRGALPKETRQIQSFAVVRRVRWKGVPARPMLPNPAQAKAIISEVVGDWVRSARQAAGG